MEMKHSRRRIQPQKRDHDELEKSLEEEGRSCASS